MPQLMPLPRRLEIVKAPKIEPVDIQALRCQLADQISDCTAAQGRARVARQIANRAEAAKAEASDIVNRLKAEREAMQRASVARHGKALADALRGGSTEPATPAPPSGDTEALDLAMARLAALDAATHQLATEANDAATAAAKSAAACRELVDAILAAEARQLAAEWLKALRSCWAMEDRLSGAAHAREALLPFDEQQAIRRQADRHQAAADADAQLIPPAYWQAHLRKLTAEQADRWNAYAARLALDAAATFEE